MSEITVKRSTEVIAVEINFYKAQTAAGIIEIGKRLIEAQDFLGEGENFTNWLKEEVEFSRSTAYNFIRVAKEFDNVQALGQLGQTKVFKLLEIPPEERENFINSEHEVNGKKKKVTEMSTRELQKVIKERDEAIKKLDDAEKIAQEASEDVKKIQEELRKERERYESDLQNQYTKINELQDQINEAESNGNEEEAQKLQKDMDALNTELAEAQNKIKELEDKLQEKPIEVAATKEVIVEKIPEEVEKELEELRRQNSELFTVHKLPEHNPAVLKFNCHFENLVESFKKILLTVDEMDNDKTKEKYSNAVKGLIEKMAERL